MGLGLTELLMLAFIGVMFLGAKETLRIAYSIGKMVRSVRRTSQDFMSELTREADLEDLRDETRKIERMLLSTEPEHRDEDMQGYHKYLAQEEHHPVVEPQEFVKVGDQSSSPAADGSPPFDQHSD